MRIIIIEVEELPSNREASDFFKLVTEAYKKECEKSTFGWGFQSVILEVV